MLTKKHIITIAALFILIFSLPAVIFLTRKAQDIRPRALQGQANLHLNVDSSDSSVGQDINVLVTLELTNENLRVSGADFVLLYDREKLEAINVVPIIIEEDENAAFTSAPTVMKEGLFELDHNYKYVRVGLVADLPNDQLKGGTVQLARITFRSIAQGDASIKFPDDNKYLEIVGIDVEGVTNPATF